MIFPWLLLEKYQPPHPPTQFPKSRLCCLLRFSPQGWGKPAVTRLLSLSAPGSHPGRPSGSSFHGQEGPQAHPPHQQCICPLLPQSSEGRRLTGGKPDSDHSAGPLMCSSTQDSQAEPGISPRIRVQGCVWPLCTQMWGALTWLSRSTILAPQPWATFLTSLCFIYYL